jgi:hypothetical protein
MEIANPMSATFCAGEFARVELWAGRPPEASEENRNGKLISLGLCESGEVLE